MTQHFDCAWENFSEKENWIEKMDETKTERIEEIGEIEENEEIQEKNAVSSLLQNFELPDITTNKKEKIPLSLDHR